MKALVLSLIIAFTGSFAMAGGPGCAAGTIGNKEGALTKSKYTQSQPGTFANGIRVK